MWVAVGFLAGTAHRSLGIALNDLAAGEIPPTNSGYSFDWNHVYKYKGASATAVDHYWILTAAHVADDTPSGNLTIDGETYTQQEVVFHSQAADPKGNPTADLALVRYDKPLPGYYLLNDSIPVGSEILIVGFGYPGDVAVQMSNSYFTQTGGSRIQRWGTNRINSKNTLSYTGPPPLGYTSNKGFKISISNTFGGPTAHEAGCNIYDSGGGMFYDDGGTWKLTGTMLQRYQYNSSQFSGNFVIATKYYVNWIKSVIVDYDTDMDGLPDWWEAAHGATAAGADPDADGFTNYEEWLADTLPNDSTSFLRITDYSSATNLVFSSSTNREYQIRYRTDLVDTNELWQTEVDWFTGSSSQTVQAVSNATSNRFFEVRAKLY